MKNRYVPILLLLTVFCCMGLNASAQDPWPRADSEWNYIYYWAWPPEGNYQKYYVNGVESVQGKTCSRIFVDNVQFNTFYTQGTEPSRYLHFDGDTLWHYVESDSAFYPLVCFNALPGDTWHPLPYDSLHIDTACTVTPIEVVDTFSVYYDGQAYRGVTTGNQQSDGHLRWTGSFDERTFKNPTISSSGSLFPFYNACGDIIVEWFSYNLLCYRDSELDIVVDNISSYAGESDCEYPWDLVQIDDPAPVELLVAYPNPTNNQIQIELGPSIEVITIKTYNASGRLVHSDKRNAAGLINYQLPDAKGVYLIRLIHSDGQVNAMKVVKE